MTAGEGTGPDPERSVCCSNAEPDMRDIGALGHAQKQLAQGIVVPKTKHPLVSLDTRGCSSRLRISHVVAVTWTDSAQTTSALSPYPNQPTWFSIR